MAGETIEHDVTVGRIELTPEMAHAAGLPFAVTPPAAAKGSPTVFNRPKKAAPTKRAAPPAKKAARKRA